MKDVELRPGHGRNLGVNTVCKVSAQFQRTPPVEEHDEAHDGAANQDLRDYFEHFINCLHVAYPLLIVLLNATAEAPAARR